MNQNKEVLKYCSNYYNIVNFDFVEGDVISERLVKLYKQYIFNANINSEEEIEKIKELDRVVNIYIEDYEFRNQLQKEILKVKVKREGNIIREFIDSILKIFNDYEEYTTRKIYIAKWI